MNKAYRIIICAFVLLVLAEVGDSLASAETRESANYKIQTDSINVAGTENSASGNYAVSDTVGEIATGISESASYKLKSGYRQMADVSLSITAPSDISMSRALTLTDNTAVASTTWTITTDNAAGYTASVKAGAAPALVDSGTGESFADYTESVSGVKETWQVTNAYEFGFSGFGDNVSGYGSDINCIGSADVPSSTLFWEGFNGTTGIELASSTAATSPSGINSTICVATEQNGIFAPSGAYSASITITVVAN